MSEEKIQVEVKTDSDSIFITASKKNVFSAIDIPCSDLQCLQEIQGFFESFDKADKREVD
jgi:hypothetical protein